MQQLSLAMALFAVVTAALHRGVVLADEGSLRVEGLKYLGKNDRGCEEYEHAKSGIVLIRIEAGTFQMGRDAERHDETPAHKVELGEYLIGKHEVTNAQFRRFCDANPDRGHPAQPPPGRGYEGYFEDARYDDYPVVGVSWDSAKAFCDWAGLRLPTEAEWEYAARGPDGRRFPWGNEAPDETRANFGKADGQGDYTREIGSYPKGASAFGALDMGGSVWEWCADWYDEFYYLECKDGVRDPRGPADGTERVVRGGSWSYFDWLTSATVRYKAAPASWSDGCGFRVVWSAER